MSIVSESPWVALSTGAVTPGLVFSIDTPCPPVLVEQLHAVGFGDARFIDLA